MEDGKLPLLKTTDGVKVIEGQTANPPFHIGITYFGGGDGSLINPYLIYNETELRNLAKAVNSDETYETYKDKHYKLMNDIDLSSNNWESIGLNDSKAFAGNFDGNGYYIKGLKASSLDNNQGLFGIVKADAVSISIKNLGVKNVNIASTGDYVGALIGKAQISNGGTIEVTNCYSTGMVKGNNFVGGLFGYSQANISNCYCTTDIGGKDNVGGIAGDNDGNIAKVYATGNILGTGNKIGGIAGANTASFDKVAGINPTITLSKDRNQIGRVIGENLDNATLNSYGFKNMTIKNSVGEIVTPSNSSVNGLDVSIDELNSSSWWKDESKMSFEDNNWIFKDANLPVLKKSDGTKVISGQDLDAPIYLTNLPTRLRADVNITGLFKYNEILTANVLSSNANSFKYQWYRGEEIIADATKKTYTTVEADIGKIIECEVTSKDYPGELRAATTEIQKLDGKDIIGVEKTDCTNLNNNNGKLLGVNASMEYRIKGGLWNDITGSELENLLGDTVYEIRMKETVTSNPGKIKSFTISKYVSSSSGSNGGNSNKGEVKPPELPKEENKSKTVEVKATAKEIRYIEGATEIEFGPDKSIDRLKALESLNELLVFKNTSSGKSNFIDVPEAYKIMVGEFQEVGVVVGKGKDNFGSYESLTRGEFSVLICKILNIEPEYAGVAFSDTEGHWSNGYMLSMKNLGYMVGYEDGTGKPDQFITSAEFVSIVNQVVTRDEDILRANPSSTKYSDVSGHWAEDAILLSIK